MQATKLYRIDLKPMLVFISVVETGNLYAAAHQVGCSGSFACVLLKQFRAAYKAPLFTREGRELSPTSEAIALADFLKAQLTKISDVTIEIENETAKFK
ncbi:LysR family transcriptional regulator [uncultured Enterobacter sp.]|uniref:LysR family transcriptional regulator n=1 Tax=uncultured Enterobacter sp. TaxID=238202 RepID=UPI0025F0E0C9|nr:LysR family transcriptional regulator [uncultured Enterobacter sp.]